MASAIIRPLGLTHTFLTSDPPVRSLPEPYVRCLSSEGVRWNDYSTAVVDYLGKAKAAE